MPAEFWREVVDRVAAEVPDTLLLAEAFWLMEGYFVRTLGMHRVYNSAFMHMLRDEKNAQYQQVIRETVSFDPRILGRYVNFMNNPDERSAVDQFGSHDKYFGVATLLATLPGLPMFGHGQVEGYSEQYGMEFRRPQRDERPNDDLVARHRREIFPLLRQRWRFAGWQGFRQLRAIDDAGEVPDVFAFSNRAYAGPAGCRGAPLPRRLPQSLPSSRRAHRRSGRTLGLGDDPEGYLILRDERSGLQYLRHLSDLRERGLELSLDGYATHVFLGFEEVSDAGNVGWAELARDIGLAGVADAHASLRWLQDAPLREAVAGLFAAPTVQAAFLPVPRGPRPEGAQVDRTMSGPADLMLAVGRLAEVVGVSTSPDELLAETARQVAAARSVRPRLLAQAVVAVFVFGPVAELACDADPERAVAAFDAWGGAAAVGDCARQAGSSDAMAWRAVELARALLAVPPGRLGDLPATGLPEHVVRDRSTALRRWLEQMAGSDVRLTGGMGRARGCDRGARLDLGRGRYGFGGGGAQASCRRQRLPDRCGRCG